MENSKTDCGPVSAQKLEIQHFILLEVVQDCIIRSRDLRWIW